MNTAISMNGKSRNILLGLTLVILTTSALARGGRLAPPAAVSCDRNQLTSWTGVVSGYERNRGSTQIQVDTDAETVEKITLEHPGSKDPSGQFLLLGEPFKKSDWKKIEIRRGMLNPGMRATVWLCEDDEFQAIIDWRPGEAKIGVPE